MPVVSQISAQLADRQDSNPQALFWTLSTPSLEAAGQLLQTEARTGLVVLRPEHWREVVEYELVRR